LGDVAETGDAQGPLAGVPALVLGAGLGTRLRPLSDHVPKPAMPLLGRPILGHALIHLYAAGCHRVWVNAHHQPERLTATLDAWAQRRLGRLVIEWSVESPKILGTGGAAKQLERELRGGSGAAAFLLLNGDSVIGMDLPALWAAHERNRAAGAIATLLCIPHPRAERYGAVRVAAGGRVLDLAGLVRPPGVTDAEVAAATACVFCGVHAVEPRVLEALPPAGREACIIRQGYVPMIQKGEEIRAFIADPEMLFHDVGTPDRYLDAQAELMKGEGRRVLAVAAGVDPQDALFQEASYAVDARGREHGSPDSVIGLGSAKLEPPVFFGPGNQLGPGCVLGPDLTVGALNHLGAGVKLRDAAVWSGVAMADRSVLEGGVAARFGGETILVRGREA
jgi:NDP-sugar pyrophosphorylase family protein